ncbi:hypothetical protein V2J09_016852 [Rumex salicifolius]
MAASKMMPRSINPSSGVFVFLFSTLAVFVLQNAASCDAGKTSSFVREAAKAIDMPLNSDVFSIPPGYNAPQQVHITQGDQEGRAVIVSWVTMEEPGSKTVSYWKEGEDKQNKKVAVGKIRTYRFYDYKSGYIHHSTIRHLETLSHYENNPSKGQAMLCMGDLSYADHYHNHDNVRWDSWGRFIERNAAYQPWIWTAGNHEIDFVPEIGEKVPFKPYKHRYPTPYRDSDSTSPFWYSIKRGPAYIIVLSSYSAYGKYTPQYQWLEKELPTVNRSETPWLIVLLHSPWYNSYNYHYMEGESMRVMFEPWFVQHKVDLVFAGHVHAYERSKRISNVAYNIENGLCKPVMDKSAPVYITIGDGGNVEGLATNMRNPQPDYSAFREASFGHAILEIKNRTHAYYAWHRNQDGFAVESDKMWFFNRVWYSVDDIEVP